jgi:hypothetical protein
VSQKKSGVVGGRCVASRLIEVADVIAKESGNRIRSLPADSFAAGSKDRPKSFQAAERDDVLEFVLEWPKP